MELNSLDLNVLQEQPVSGNAYSLMKNFTQKFINGNCVS